MNENMTNNLENSDNNLNLFETFSVQIFKSVPENAVLVCYNRFNGKTTIKHPGLTINAPWCVCKLVNVAARVIDYPKESYITSDGIYLEADPAIVISIKDAKKYLIDNNNAIQELGILTKDLIRSYMKKTLSDDVINNLISKDMIDQNNATYSLFTARTGVAVEQVYFKNVELPKDLKDDYEKERIQERENARAIAESESKIKQAKNNLKTSKINAEAEAYRDKVRLVAGLEALLDKVPNDQLGETLRTWMISNSKDAKIFANIGEKSSTLGSGDMMSTAAILSLLKDEISKNSNTKTADNTNNNTLEGPPYCPKCGSILTNTEKCSVCFNKLNGPAPRIKIKSKPNNENK